MKLNMVVVSKFPLLIEDELGKESRYLPIINAGTDFKSYIRFLFSGVSSSNIPLDTGHFGMVSGPRSLSLQFEQLLVTYRI